MNVVGWMARYRDTARFRRMFELPMTAHSCDQRPAVSSEKLQHVTDPHIGHMISEPNENQKPYNVRVDAAARIKHPSPHQAKLRNTLPPLASNGTMKVGLSN